MKFGLAKSEPAPDLPWLSADGKELRKKFESGEVKEEDIGSAISALRGSLTRDDVLYLTFIGAVLGGDAQAIREATVALQDASDEDLAAFGKMTLKITDRGKKRG